jgi:hypothetical protein
LVWEGSSSSFLNLEPAILISSCIHKLKAVEWLKKWQLNCHTSCNVDSKLLTKKPLNKLSGELWLWTGNNIGYPLFTEVAHKHYGPLIKCHGQERWAAQGSSNHILCQCPALVMYRIEIFRPPLLELTDIRRASTKIVLVLAL